MSYIRRLKEGEPTPNIYDLRLRDTPEHNFAEYFNYFFWVPDDYLINPGYDRAEIKTFSWLDCLLDPGYGREKIKTSFWLKRVGLSTCSDPVLLEEKRQFPYKYAITPGVIRRRFGCGYYIIEKDESKSFSTSKPVERTFLAVTRNKQPVKQPKSQSQETLHSANVQKIHSKSDGTQKPQQPLKEQRKTLDKYEFIRFFAKNQGEILNGEKDEDNTA